MTETELEIECKLKGERELDTQQDRVFSATMRRDPRSFWLVFGDRNLILGLRHRGNTRMPGLREETVVGRWAGVRSHALYHSGCLWQPYFCLLGTGITGMHGSAAHFWYCTSPPWKLLFKVLYHVDLSLVYATECCTWKSAHNFSIVMVLWSCFVGHVSRFEKCDLAELLGFLNVEPF